MKKSLTVGMLIMCGLTAYAQDSDKSWFESDLASVMNHSTWFIVLIVLLSCIIGILEYKRKHQEHLEGIYHKTNLLLFNLVCLLEWGYFLMARGNVFWFMMPDVVGWKFLLSFLIVALIARTQALSFLHLMADIRHIYHVKFSLCWGVGSTFAVIPLLFLFASIWGDNGMLYSVLIYIVCQLIQLIVIFFGILKGAGLMYAIIGVLTYIIAYLPLLSLLVMAAITLLALLGIKFVFSLKETKENPPTGDYIYDTYYNN